MQSIAGIVIYEENEEQDCEMNKIVKTSVLQKNNFYSNRYFYIKEKTQ